MTGLVVILLGAVLGVGLVALIAGTRPGPERTETKVGLRNYRARGQRSKAARRGTENALQVLVAAALAAGGWYVTGWPVAAVLGVMAGAVVPWMLRAPQRRRQLTDEIEAYGQWAEQIRDLVSASGSLYEAVVLSAENAPERLRPAVMNMAAMARAVGLPAALDWFADEMRSPFADRLVLGMHIAWDSGARVSEAFESTARGMRAEVDMRRRNEVANSRAWTQVVAILGVTVVAVGLMFIINRGFFDPFGTVIGQVVLLGAGIVVFGNVFWVLRLSEMAVPIRLLASDPPVAAGAIDSAGGTRGEENP